jgi:phosphatidylserine/phosphatidylglycerophosphate/cardiolipin synthase-like enzyme
VLLEVIGAAEASLTLVSFAAYKVPVVVERLRKAATGGVIVDLILETEDDSRGALSVDAAAAFGSLHDCVNFWVWPADKRPDAVNGKASLHAKAALADGRVAFVTSANLTGAAQTNNMELGVVVTGGPIPERLDRPLSHPDVGRDAETRHTSLTPRPPDASPTRLAACPAPTRRTDR